MIRYQPNNIIFRIASSDAISKFKALQAQSFVQLARKELNFNTSAKEVVLLEYDRFSQWLFRIERICMAAQEGRMPMALRQAIQESFCEELRTVETVLDSHPDVFDGKISAFVKVIHKYSVNIILDRMELSVDKTVDRAFYDIVQIVSDYLQHVLTCLHEINHNYIVSRSATPFISASDFCTKCDTEFRFLPIKKRTEFFDSIGLGKTYILKNYSSEDIYDEAMVYLDQYGIRLQSEVEEPKVAYA